MEKAVEILAKAGWKPDPENGVLEKTVKKTTERLEFTISTSNTPELKSAALIIKESWEKLGAKVNLAFFDTGDLNQGIIRPRKYDALLFGEIVGRDLDLYAFWHSSQRNDPGLNIANYTNIKADKILEQARTTNDIFDRLDKYNSFAEEVAKDIPAIFIYSPYFIYILPEKIKGVEILNIALPSERFLDVKDWFIETDHVWKIFANKQRREMIIN
jgi:peptide/nickel transport system substrate-binding protein